MTDKLIVCYLKWMTVITLVCMWMPFETTPPKHPCRSSTHPMAPAHASDMSHPSRTSRAATRLKQFRNNQKNLRASDWAARGMHVSAGHPHEHQDPGFSIRTLYCSHDQCHVLLSAVLMFFYDFQIGDNLMIPPWIHSCEEKKNS